MNQRYDYSSTQANLPEPLAKRIIRWGKDAIPEENIFRNPKDPTFGREDEIHVTILYGLLDSSPDEIRELLANQSPFEVKLGKTSVFDTNDKFDVVKVEAQGEGLFNLNKLLKSNFRYTTKFPTYIPHVTVAYVRKGKGSEYVGDAAFVGDKFTVEEIIFSSRNGSKHRLPLKSGKPA